MASELKELWERMQAPLVLCARDSFARLADIKNVEAAVAARAQQLSVALENAGWRKVAQGVSQIANTFDGFSEIPPARQQEIIAGALVAITELERNCHPPAPIPASGASEAGKATASVFPAETLSARAAAVGAFGSPSSLAVVSPRPTASSDSASIGHSSGGANSSCATAKQKISAPLQFLKGIGPHLAALLAKKSINTIEEFLYFLPRHYEDRRRLCSVANAPLDGRAVIIGKVLSAGFVLKRHRRVFEALIGDHRQQLRASWFHGNFAYLAKNLVRNARVLLTGEVRIFGYLKTMVHPEWELIDDDEETLQNRADWQRIVPIYSETEGLSSKTLRRIMQGALSSHAGLLLDELPPSIVQKHRLMPLAAAIAQAHFPPNDADLNALNGAYSDYHRRIIYDEFFFLQLGIGLRRSMQKVECGIAFTVNRGALEHFYQSLPFALTGAQHRVIAEIASDMQKPTAMSRLLQGDVGSGKTLVAFAAMLIACHNGCQAVLMAPTELLAQQHFANLQARAEVLGFPAALLTGSLTASQKKTTLEAIAGGRAKIIIGTHALLYEQTSFARVGLVVIDEQHRFGVAQRAAMRKKGFNPDVLVMTATPIPRTLAMSVYGDLDVSVIDELPPTRTPIKTKLYFEAQRAQVYDLIHKEVAKGNQAFIVYPLIEESDALGLKDASRMAEHLQTDVFPNFVVGLVHGRLKPLERDAMMKRFQHGEINILAATTVVEVGIDIPEASVMVIENAERFGLSQLHQQRGRVGRGKAQSYCLLLAQSTGSSEARRRLRVMETTNNGFKIAEEDLAIRGPGELLGTRQAGIPDFRVGNIARDVKLLAQAREDVQELLKIDARLERPEHRYLWAVLQRRWQGRLGFARIG